METVTVEVGIERVWSDNDFMSQDGYGTVAHEVVGWPVIAPSGIVKLESTFERLWSNEDEVQVASPHKICMAA